MQVMLDLVLKTGSCHSMEFVVVWMTHNNKRDVWVMQLGGNGVCGAMFAVSHFGVTWELGEVMIVHNLIE